MEQIRSRGGSELNEKVVTMAVISLLGSVLLIGFALWTMWAAVAPSFDRMSTALLGQPRHSPLPAWQRRQRPVMVARVSVSRLALRAAA
jgi:hypothetical protein